MEYNTVVLIAAIIGIAGVSYMIHVENQNIALLEVRVKKLRNSPLFEKLEPMLRGCRNRSIEQVIVDSSGVIIRFMYPAGAESRFIFLEEGFKELSDLKLEAIAQLIEKAVPRLHDSSMYRLSKRTTRLINGDKHCYYTYIMRTSYKNSLARAQYYNGELQSGLW